MAWVTVTSDLLLAMGYVFLGVVLALIGVYVRTRRVQKGNSRAAQGDAAASIRAFSDASEKERRCIRAAQQELAKATVELKEELVKFQALLAEAAALREGEAAPVWQALASPEGVSNEGESEPWVGLDLGEEDPSRSPFQIPEAVPEEPREPEAARQIFRAMLKMEKKKGGRAGKKLPAAERGNGAEANQMLRTRVYEYADARMSIAEIAHELGIGKGEVRLILSLRESN